MVNWTQYGQLNSPFESLGYEKALYAEKKKKEIFTDSRAYLDGRSAFLNGIKDEVNNSFTSMMGKLDGLPFSEKERIAKEEARRTKDRMYEIMNSIWPGADLAYGQQQNLNVASAVVAGNVVVDNANIAGKKVKVARAKKTPAKKPKAALKAKEPAAPKAKKGKKPKK